MIDYGKELQKAYNDGYKARDAEIVRCKDCKWWRSETDHTCRYWGGASPRNANSFCADGEVATVKDEANKDSGDVK